MKNEELKECPFCKTKPVIIEFKTEDGKGWKYDGVHGYVGCNNDDCLLCGHHDFYFIESDDEDEVSKADAIKFWNTRPREQELEINLGRLQNDFDIVDGGNVNYYKHNQELKKENIALKEEQLKTACSIGVGTGSGNLFVHGTYEAIKRVQNTIFRKEELEAKLEISPEHNWDGIDCRNETIKMLEDRVKELEEETKYWSNKWSDEVNTHVEVMQDNASLRAELVKYKDSLRPDYADVFPR